MKSSNLIATVGFLMIGAVGGTIIATTAGSAKTVALEVDSGWESIPNIGLTYDACPNSEINGVCSSPVVIAHSYVCAIDGTVQDCGYAEVVYPVNSAEIVKIRDELLAVFKAKKNY